MSGGTTDKRQAPERRDDAAREGKGERIAKVIARAGICSRRDAERLIGEGRVTLNGRIQTTPAVTVGPQDRIEVNGKPLAARERTRLWLFHKPRGLVTTNRDPEGRRTVFSALPPDMPRVLTVGRLDINTEGLLLLTNDGGLARVLELPSTGWLRRYRVRAHGRADQPALDALRRGVTIEGMIYGAIEAEVERLQGTNIWLSVGLREGKNREVKRVLEHLGLSVNRLIRVSYGPFQLGDLAEGEVREVRGRVLRDQLGEKLASAAGADFDTPVHTPEPDATPARGKKPQRRMAGGKRPEAAPREGSRRKDSGGQPAKADRKPASKADETRRPRHPSAEPKPARKAKRADDRAGPESAASSGRPAKQSGPKPRPKPTRNARADRRRTP